MPSENMKFMPGENLMSAREIIKLASIFKDFGVKKIRFTGGEPTLRKDLEEIVAGISNLNLSMSITTNGLLLKEHLHYFEKYGLFNINVSIDSIQREKFKEITKRDCLQDVISNMELAKASGFALKLNMVVIRHLNDEEIVDILKWSSDLKIPVRFIEYMPFFGNEWHYKRVFTQKEILNVVSKDFKIVKLESASDSTSDNYFISELNNSFGIIPTVTNNFCSGCSRIRLTADGKIKNCLFSADESDLLGSLRRGENVREIIADNISRKKKKAAGRINFNDEKALTDYTNNRSMVAIGG